LFEMGFFMGALGRCRTFIVRCEEDSIKLPTDLAGITWATYKRRSDDNWRSALGPTATKLREAMQKAPSRSGATLSILDVLRQRLTRHQRQTIIAKMETLSGIADLCVWPENRTDVEKVADLFVQFEDRRRGERSFVIFFEQYVTRPFTIYQLFEALAILDPAKLYLCLENVLSHPDPYLSVRDLFARHTASEYANAQELFKAKGMIQPVHRAEEDVRQHFEGRKAGQVKYGGPIADGFSLEELKSAASTMEEIRTFGAEVIRADLVLSPTHITISCWSRTIPWMVVTSTDSDKSQLLLFAETPVVTQKGGLLTYYGDPSRLPSSEAVPHWFIHTDLCAANREAWRCVLHIHSDPLTSLAENGDVRFDGGIFLPTLPYIEYGTERMGHMLAEAMIRSETTAASVQNHGQWFVAHSFDDALRQARLAHEAAIEKLRGVRR